MASQDHQSLTLGLSLSSSTPKTNPTHLHHSQPPLLVADHHEPRLTLSLSGDLTYQGPPPPPEPKPEEPPCSAASSAAANGVVPVKRERESASSDDMDGDRGCNYSISRGSDEDEDGSGPTTASTRKKLRLNKDQSALLEESFKQHSTLNPKQKQALADRLNLRPRQVEVWFQNRRARTKLKQTEVDCEYLKKCCETLTDENRRLQKELQELKALKMGGAAQPLYMHLPAATLTMCPSCERMSTTVPIAAGGAPASSKTPFISMAAKPPFYASFTNSSAAC